MLAMLPDEQAGPLLTMVAALGVDVSGLSATPATADVLHRLMEHQAALDEERVENLVAVLDDEARSGMEKVRASKRLTELSPARAGEVAAAIIAVHVAAARALDVDATADRRMILGQLSTLPLGEMSRDAVHASAVTDGEIALAQGRLDDAFEILERFDPALAEPDVRALYENILRARWDDAMQQRDWALAAATIARGEAASVESIDLGDWQATLERRRALPLRILAWSIAGALTLLALYALHAFGLTAAIRRRIAERDARRAELSRQWEPDVVEATHADDASASDDALPQRDSPQRDSPQRDSPQRDSQVDERDHTGPGDDGEAIADSWSAPSHDEQHDLAEDEPQGEDDRSPLDDFAA
jgi:hypothetical protein